MLNNRYITLNGQIINLNDMQYFDIDFNEKNNEFYIKAHFKNYAFMSNLIIAIFDNRSDAFEYLEELSESLTLDEVKC